MADTTENTEESAPQAEPELARLMETVRDSPSLPRHSTTPVFVSREKDELSLVPNSGSLGGSVDTPSSEIPTKPSAPSWDDTMREFREARLLRRRSIETILTTGDYFIDSSGTMNQIIAGELQFYSDGTYSFLESDGLIEPIPRGRMSTRFASFDCRDYS